MANRKPATDVNAEIAAQLRKATDSPPQDGADLILDPKLRQAYVDLKKWGQEREAARKRRS